MKEILQKILTLLQALWGWLRLRPRNAIISAIGFLAIVVGLILFIKIVLPALIAIGFFVWLIFGDAISAFIAAIQAKPLTLEDDGVAWEVTNFMFSSVSSVNDVLTGYVSAASTVNDIYDGADYRGTYNNAPMLKLRLLRKQKDITPDDLTYIKNALQGAADARIRDGHLIGNDWAVKTAADISLVKVAAVTISAAYVHIDILLVNTPASVKAARMSDNPAPPPSIDSTDPLFRRGGN